jgi:hypothetical protein
VLAVALFKNVNIEISVVPIKVHSAYLKSDRTIVVFD